MPVDNQRYVSLVQRAAFNAELWRGTWQDLSSAQRTMTAVGTPGWSRINGFPCLRQNVANDGCSNVAVPSIVDVTGAFTIEALINSMISGNNHILGNVPGGFEGGFEFWRVLALSRCVIQLRNIAGAVVREIYGPAAGAETGRLQHLVYTSLAGGAGGLVWHGGVPSVVTLYGAGASANYVGNGSLVAGGTRASGGSTGITASVLIRAYPFALTNEDAQVLHAQARLLTGGDV